MKFKQLNIPLKELKEKHMNGISASLLANEYNCNIWSIIDRLKKLNVYKSQCGFQKGCIPHKSLSKKQYVKMREKIRKSQLGSKNSNWNGGSSILTSICECCGKVIKKHKCGREKIRFCSNECAHKVMVNPMKGKFGKEHPCWKEEKAMCLNDTIRTSQKYKEWRKAVFERDDYTCQKCKCKGTYLEVHHIKPLSIIINEYNIKTYDNTFSCKELWDINNGITYCLNCHMKEDKMRNKFRGNKEKRIKMSIFKN